jgi:hypothetical protein
MTVDVLFLAAAVPPAPVGDTWAAHIPVGADIREAAHIREAVGSKAPHSASTCDRMDPDGNLADTKRARTRSA